MRYILVAMAFLAIAGVARADNTASGSLTASWYDSDHNVQSYTYDGTITTDDNGNYQSFSTSDTSTISGMNSVVSWSVSYEDPTTEGMYWNLTGYYVTDSDGNITGTPLVNMTYADEPDDDDPPIPGDTPPTQPTNPNPTGPVLPAIVGTLKIISSSGSLSISGPVAYDGNGNPYIKCNADTSATISNDAVFQLAYYDTNGPDSAYGYYWYTYTGDFEGTGFGGDGSVQYQNYNGPNAYNVVPGDPTPVGIVTVTDIAITISAGSNVAAGFGFD